MLSQPRFSFGGSSLCALAVGPLLIFALIMMGGCPQGPGDSDSEDGPGVESAAEVTNTLTLSFAFSRDKQAWIPTCVERFHETGATVGEDQRVRIKAEPMALWQMRDAIAQADGSVHLVSPATRAGLAWLTKQAGEAPDKPGLKGRGSIARSPMVVGMHRKLAEALATWRGDRPRPLHRFPWKLLVELAANEGGWSELGLGELGPLRMRMGHPRADDSAILGLSLLRHAVGDWPPPRVKREVAAVPRHCVAFGDDPAHHVATLLRSDPQQLHGVIVPEHSLLHGLADGAGSDGVGGDSADAEQNLSGGVVTVYPQGPAWVCEHPIALVQPETLSRAQGQAVDQWIEFLLSDAAQRVAMSVGLRPADPERELDPDRWPSLAGASGESDGPASPANPPEPLNQAQTAFELWREGNRSAAVYLVLDYSASMAGADKLAAVQAAVTNRIQRRSDADRVSIMTFNNRFSWREQNRELKRYRGRLINAIKDPYAHGGSAVFDALDEADRRVHQHFKRPGETGGSTTDALPGRMPAIVLIVDGPDRHSELSRSELLGRLQPGPGGFQPPVYCVAYGPEAPVADLRAIAEQTGGKVFQADPDTVDEVLRRVSSFF